MKNLEKLYFSSYIIKSAARGDQLIKGLKSLLTAAQQGNPASKQVAYSKLNTFSGNNLRSAIEDVLNVKSPTDLNQASEYVTSAFKKRVEMLLRKDPQKPLKLTSPHMLQSVFGKSIGRDMPKDWKSWVSNPSPSHGIDSSVADTLLGGVNKFLSSK
jgi:hypothetical protein